MSGRASPPERVVSEHDGSGQLREAQLDWADGRDVLRVFPFFSCISQSRGLISWQVAVGASGLVGAVRPVASRG
jgi:hypothetical protein